MIPRPHVLALLIALPLGAMEADTRSWIEVVVRGGFEPADTIVTLARENDPGASEADIRAAITDVADRVRREVAAHAGVTDVERLERAFAALNAAGIIALQNAGYTMSDGHSDVGEFARRHRDVAFRGYCFFHGQDLEAALRGGGLYLAFGPMDPASEQDAGVGIGRAVVAALRAEGLTVEWDETFAQRILVRPFVWLKRIP